MQAGRMRRDGWGVSTCVSISEAELRVGGGGVWVTGWKHTHTRTHRGRALNPGAQRSQVCGVIILNLGVHLLII